MDKFWSSSEKVFLPASEFLMICLRVWGSDYRSILEMDQKQFFKKWLYCMIRTSLKWINKYSSIRRLIWKALHWYASGFGKADFGGPFCFVRYRVTSQWGARIYRTNINKQSGYLTIKKQIYYTKIDVTTLLAIFPRTILKSFSLFSNKDYGDISPVWFHMVWFQSYWLT